MWHQKGVWFKSISGKINATLACCVLNFKVPHFFILSLRYFIFFIKLQFSWFLWILCAFTSFMTCCVQTTLCGLNKYSYISLLVKILFVTIAYPPTRSNKFPYTPLTQRNISNIKNLQCENNSKLFIKIHLSMSGRQAKFLGLKPESYNVPYLFIWNMYWFRGL